MSRGPRIAALAATLALPVGAGVASLLLLNDPAPPHPPAVVRIGESVPLAPPATSVAPSSEAPSSEAPERQERTRLPPPPPVDDDDDDDAGEGDDNDDDGGDGDD
jgi:hypothetical protein